MNDCRTIRGYMGFALVAAAVGLGSAWAEEKVTIKPDETITIKSDSGGKITIRHDAIADTYDEAYSAITVKTAPPEPRNEEELMKVRPDEQAVWIPGYWRWNTTASEYEWVSGVWRRQIPNETWHAGKWISVDGNYTWQRGYWGREGDAKYIVVKEAPPVAREETRGNSPGTEYIWIAGLWKYDDGKYVWLPGSWERPATKDMTWVSGAWLKTSSGYEYVPGHWDYTSETRTYTVNVN